MSPTARRNGMVLIALLLVGLAIWQSGLVKLLDLGALKAHQWEWQTWVSANPVMASLAYVLVYVAVTALSIPGATVMTLAGGALFGLWWGVLLVSFGSSIGATLAMLVSRYLLREPLQQRHGLRLKSFNEGVARDGGWYLLSLRLVPVVPFFLVNILAGLTDIRTRSFYLVSQVGMFPATVAYVFAGTQLTRIHTLSDVMSPGLWSALLILAVLPWLLRWLSAQLAVRRIYRGYRKPKRWDYNLIVIGAGSAGLVSAYIAAAVKAKVALIERHRMGGDCLNTGCVPSKALIRTARLCADMRQGARYGLGQLSPTIDFAEVMARVKRVIAQVELHDSPERYRSLGVDVIHGDAKLVSPWQVAVDGRVLSARSVIIATGARPTVPTLPGLDPGRYLTSDTLWELTHLPQRLLVLGGGPIGCELAQCFARFGSEVRIVEMAERLLPREDPDVSEAISEALRNEGITLATGHRALRVEGQEGMRTLVCEHAGAEQVFAFDAILVALGRSPNTAGFGLDALGVQLSERGAVVADPLMRTNFPNIHVCGDVTGPFQFTHVAAHQAWYASVNALLAPFWSFRVDYRVIPWAVFTDPEYARVGYAEHEARAAGVPYEVSRYGIDDLDRAIADSAAHGFVKVLTAPGSDRILGASIVGQHAGELIAEFVQAMKHGIGLNAVLSTIHVYPTWSEANKYVAGVWKRAHAPVRALRWAERFFQWRRGASAASADPQETIL